jgi:Anti-sigma-K factor rskA
MNRLDLKKKMLPIWAIVASLVAIILLFQNFNLKKALANSEIENKKAIDNQKNVAYKLDILRRADTKIIEMKGLDVSPNAKVLVYWNAHEKATLLSIQHLDEPKKGKQYQLWAIIDQKPVDAGVFVYDLTAVQLMRGFEKAETFAVTLEKEGGNETPNMEEMYVIGTVL